MFMHNERTNYVVRFSEVVRLHHPGVAEKDTFHQSCLEIGDEEFICVVIGQFLVIFRFRHVFGLEFLALDPT